MRTQNLTIGGVWQQHVKGPPGAPAESTWRTWLTNGTKFAAIAGAGGHYFFVLMGH
jgi:hypothetical protein